MDKNLLPTGQIVNTHGLRGDMKVMPWADDPDDLLDFDRFFIDGKEYEVQHSSRQKSMILLKLRGIDTIEDANKLRNKELCISRDDVELEDGVVFIADLIGLPVFADGVEIGKITEVLTMPSSDVYVIQGEHKYMIPSVKEFVKEINVAQGYVRIHLIEGMATDEN